MKGYEPYHTRLTRTVNGWLFGNILLGGPIGLVVDAVTGAIYELSPEDVNVYLRKNDLSHVTVMPEGCIGVVASSEPHWKKVDQLQSLH